MVRAGTIDEFKFAGIGRLPFLRKGNESRTIYLSERVLDALNIYLESRADANAALFATESGGRMTAQHVRRLLHVWCDRLGVERFRIHDFRRRMAERLTAVGMSITAVAIVLGWSPPRFLGKPSIRLNFVTFDDRRSTAARDHATS